jgi:hypothetical protein
VYASVRNVRDLPLELSPEEVKLGLSQLEFRDQLSRKVLKNDLRVFEDTGRFLHEKRVGGLYGTAGRHHRQDGIDGLLVAPGSRLSGDPDVYRGVSNGRSMFRTLSQRPAKSITLTTPAANRCCLCALERKTGESPLLPTGLSSPVRVAQWICWLIKRQGSSSFARLQRM